MTVQQFIDMTIDTKVEVRDKKTGKYLKSGHWDMEVCGVYAKHHRCGNPPKERAEIVIFAK